METQSVLAKALALPDPEKLAAAALPVLKAAPEFTVPIVAALGEAGPKALPALRELIKDESLGWHLSCVFPALAKAGGVSAGPELTEIVRQELAFWKKVAPGLKDGWWNGEGLQWAEVDPLRNRYGKTHGVLRALETLRFAPCRKAVMDFRDYWCSQPKLAFAGNDQVGATCNAILKSLR